MFYLLKTCGEKVLETPMICIECLLKREGFFCHQRSSLVLFSLKDKHLQNVNRFFQTVSYLHTHPFIQHSQNYKLFIQYMLYTHGNVFLNIFYGVRVVMYCAVHTRVKHKKRLLRLLYQFEHYINIMYQNVIGVFVQPQLI